MISDFSPSSRVLWRFVCICGRDIKLIYRRLALSALSMPLRYACLHFKVNKLFTLYLKLKQIFVFGQFVKLRKIFVFGLFQN